CQVECVEIVTSAKRAVLSDFDGKPIGKANVVIRDASRGVHGACGNFGDVVTTVTTNSNGRFQLSSLNTGIYWITYIDSKDGESFLVRIDPAAKSKHPLELSVDQLNGLCYLIDVERNKAKTANGLPKPIERD